MYLAQVVRTPGVHLVAIADLNPAGAKKNLARVAELVGRAAERGASLVVLPENFAFMGLTEVDKLAIAESPGAGPIQSWLAETAKKHGAWLVGGSVPLECRTEGKVRNSCLVYNPEGTKANLYATVGPAVEGGVVLSGNGHTPLVNLSDRNPLS